ncbi:hypothetical protein GCM10009665_39790 [Kitasatospora nipponensis]|uniref:CRISPR-associated Cas5t family protein n=1 Tax=Kitasatospora nipponensis TaxID=258049 RepID=A0ABP4GZE8_9ACTN
MSTPGTPALQVTVTAPVVSFRNPLYAGVQVTLPCPPPSTAAGLLAAAAGGWPEVDPGLRLAMAFHAGGAGVDLETYHPLDAGGKTSTPAPRNREFLADATLTLWLLDDVDLWYRRLRRPVWPLRLGRSQDLVGLHLEHTTLSGEAGEQRTAVVPDHRGAGGTLLRLPTAVAPGRGRTRWDAYRFDVTGRTRVPVPGSLSTAAGLAVAPLRPVHPDAAFGGDVAAQRH